MWITFSLFLRYSYVKASVQCENRSHNDKSFTVIPNMPGSNGPKWIGLQPCYNSGLGHATISDRWITMCFTIHSYIKNIAYKQLILLFCSSLGTKHNWHHNRHNQGRRQRICPPSAPHEALLSVPTLWLDGQQPSKLADVFFGGIEGVYGPQSAPLFRQWFIATTLECFEGHTHPQPQPQKLYPLSWGVVAHPFDALVWSARPHVRIQGALTAGGGHGLL